jgi:hypothetical protein
MKKQRDCQICATPPSFPLSGAEFSRRGFIRLGGLGLVASFFSDAIHPSLLQAQSAIHPSLNGKAKNCIVIYLEGGASQTDLWDLKEGSWTPANLEPTSYGEIRWPRGLMPKMADHLGKMAFVRSGLAWVAVHNLAQLWTQIGRNPASLLGRIAPHIGAVVALESYATRKPEDVLPAFIAFETPKATTGYFPAKYAPFVMRAGNASTSSLRHPDGNERLDRRLALLEQLDPDRTGALGKEASDFADFTLTARRLTESPDVAALFAVSGADHLRYGNTTFGDSLILAKQLIASERGTRFVQATSYGWDHHSDIYNAIRNRSRELDTSLGALLDDLGAMPGSEQGKTLLDETLVVIYSEFGRTVGYLSPAGGRDHFARMSIVFAGGGVRGNRVIGKTDAQGSKAVEYGWRGNRDVRPEDVTATIYSALGIDYTTVRRDDPLNRGFDYVPLAREGAYEPVSEIFI